MLDVTALRRQFPALQQQREDRTPIFLDGPAGTQVPQRAISAIVHYLSTCNANHGGVFATSRESDQLLETAHQWTAEFLNAPSASEIIFGANMTTLTFQFSRAIGATLKPGDEIMVTQLDHDANITPWLLAARDAGATVKWVNINRDNCTLDIDSLKEQLSARTRLVAVTCASNMTGAVVDVAEICRLAHQAGALVFLDAVHFAPHRSIDVQAWDCDFLACSAYKFFGPHLGVLWGRRELLQQLPAYKLKPVSDELPGRWMTGTQNHECLAGLVGTFDYLLEIGSRNQQPNTSDSDSSMRRMQFHAALEAIEEYETGLVRRLLRGLAARPQFRVWGIADEGAAKGRVPTVAITHATKSPALMAEHLASRQIYAWNGNMYAQVLSEALDLEKSGGILRLGLVHYNTVEEVDTLKLALDEL